MAPNCRHFCELPALFKPFMLFLLIILFILYAACPWNSWWSWFSCILQIIIVALMVLGILFEYNSQMVLTWLTGEMVICATFILICFINLITHLRWLFKRKNALYGVQAIFIVLTGTVYILNGLMVYKIWLNLHRGQGNQNQPGNGNRQHPPTSPTTPGYGTQP